MSVLSDVSTPGLGDTGGAGGGAGAARAARWLLIRLYPVVLVLAVWQVLALTETLGNEFVLPAPLSVWHAGVELAREGVLVDAVVVTGGRVLAAFLLAVVVGVGVGLLVGRFRLARRAARPLLAFGFPTPKIAIYPALVILFGLGAASKIALGFVEAFFPIALATAAAASRVDHHLVWTARALGTAERRVLVDVVLPSALPGILTGARIGLVGAIIGVFIAEMVVSPDGLGNLMSRSWATLQTPEMYVAIVAVSILGFVLDRTFLLMRARLLRWSAESG